MTGIRQTSARLADGREIVYFDDPGTPARERRLDARALDPRPATPTMRYDALAGDWITVATARQGRVHLPPADADPLAPQSPGNPSEIPDDYDVAVFENRSPSFGPGTASALPGASAPAEGEREALTAIGATRPAVGRCEVVSFSPDHAGSFGTQPTLRARTVVEAWASRTAALSAVPGVEHVFPFENRGVEIGVTLPHPHGQVYAYPFVPPRIRRICAAVDAHGPGLFAELLDAEREGPRVLIAGERFTAFVPFAARWPVEVQLMAHRHVPDLAATTDAERDELATLTLRIARGLDALYDAPLPYIAAWVQAPVHEHRDDVRLHWHVTSPRRAADKLKFLAGSEAAMGAWVGDISPEDGAARLRDAIARADEQHPVEPLARTQEETTDA
ncbi:galactose-1-phosphate uridylyltransferase [Agrococcus sp. SCSIO52902]|uniref:galactose-1-phosphate uridylyltransferase n=1 Tax=Agrococcus sp. SCSIO52902 TaxID=2933290 RepID=UPI001FF18E1B|nr:galactose-1-phosphate uridylyltransferase [Agrococcus sp. SCSIO52902]UOW01309.1 galactose-1-phosphate uridylyltransferase [Agrococcus sp. SCSIO52902]